MKYMSSIEAVSKKTQVTSSDVNSRFSRCDWQQEGPRSAASGAQPGQNYTSEKSHENLNPQPDFERKNNSAWNKSITYCCCEKIEFLLSKEFRISKISDVVTKVNFLGFRSQENRTRGPLCNVFSHEHNHVEILFGKVVAKEYEIDNLFFHQLRTVEYIVSKIHCMLRFEI